VFPLTLTLAEETRWRRARMESRNKTRRQKTQDWNAGIAEAGKSRSGNSHILQSLSQLRQRLQVVHNGYQGFYWEKYVRLTKRVWVCEVFALPWLNY
ncbi:MAG: hypothetical protein ACK49X_09785, partial [Akkermansiaceae bacterium]